MTARLMEHDANRVDQGRCICPPSPKFADQIMRWKDAFERDQTLLATGSANLPDMPSYALIAARLNRTRSATNLSIFLAPGLSKKTILVFLSVYLAMIAILVIGPAKSHGSATALDFGFGPKTASASVQVKTAVSPPDVVQIFQLHIAPPYIIEFGPHQ